ncbi:DNA polymerase family X lyase domain [Phytophthora cinnamomi]|uniref:DNA polymerase family X lyase domain n=1 Tax=Phytophthora cinnamomi TaxID=4785 RepID=UPI00355AA96B|nr:DNA polymerase family X lyase domain [Phytophthora cinnamomi]
MKDPLEARAEAVEAIIHSLKDGKASLGDAQDELQQKYGLEAMWKQYMENEEAKRQRRRQSHQKKSSGRAKDPRRSKNLGSLTESPPLDDELETETSGQLQRDAQHHKSSSARVGVMTPSKRPVASQEPAGGNAEMKIAKKVKSARGLVVSGASGGAEEKPHSSEKKSSTGLGNILSSGPGSPDEGIVDLLGLEDLGDPDGDNDMSSDGEFTL